MRRAFQVVSVIAAFFAISVAPLAAAAGDAAGAITDLLVATILVLVAILAEKIEFPDDPSGGVT